MAAFCVVEEGADGMPIGSLCGHRRWSARGASDAHGRAARQIAVANVNT